MKAAMMNKIASFRAMCLSRISRNKQATADIPTTQSAYSKPSAQYEFKGIPTDAFFSPLHPTIRNSIRRIPTEAVAAPVAAAARYDAIPHMTTQITQETT